MCLVTYFFVAQPEAASTKMFATATIHKVFRLDLFILFSPARLHASVPPYYHRRLCAWRVVESGDNSAVIAMFGYACFRSATGRAVSPHRIGRTLRRECG